MNVDVHELELIQFAAETAISDLDARQVPNLTTHISRELDRMVIGMRAKVWGNQKVIEYKKPLLPYMQFPASPWQHFKERYAPRWFRNFWPVVYEKRSIPMVWWATVAYALFPEYSEVQGLRFAQGSTHVIEDWAEQAGSFREIIEEDDYLNHPDS